MNLVEWRSIAGRLELAQRIELLQQRHRVGGEPPAARLLDVDELAVEHNGRAALEIRESHARTLIHSAVE
jgi:hypothetical protein